MNDDGGEETEETLTSVERAKDQLAFYRSRGMGEGRDDYICLGCSTTKGEGRYVVCLGPKILNNREDRIRALFAGFTPDELFYYRKRYLVFDVAMGRDYELIKKAGNFLSYEKRKRRMKAAGFHLKAHYRVLWDIQEGRCYYSGERLGTEFHERKFHVDHIIPVAVAERFLDAGPAGTNWPINLALTTAYANKAKGGRRPEDFFREVRKMKSFTPRPLKERRKIDRLRLERFEAFMDEHSPKWAKEYE